MAQLFIGTSGWTHAEWKGLFYPETLKRSELLPFYARHFKSAEISSSFEQAPKPGICRRWASRTPREFVFSLVAPRHITHLKRLEDVGKEWRELLDLAAPLGDKLGPLLLQCPPSLERDVDRIRRFVELAPDARDRGLAFEFRHESWFDPLTLDDLRKLGVAVVLAQSERYPMPPRVPTAGFLYLRFHGPGQMFASSYSTDELRPWARKIQVWLDRDLPVHAYFTNDFEGHAVANANTLRRLVLGKPVGPAAAVAG